MKNSLEALESKTRSWLMNRIEAKPLIIGINGPQGIGKSTLCQKLFTSLNAIGVSTVHLSIDDFYLTRSEQLVLSAKFPLNPFLQHRGYPGTHDLSLGLETLSKLKQSPLHAPVRIPRYNKSAHHGEGDRSDPSTWTLITQPPKLILLEGWMLGFKPVPASQSLSRDLAQINTMLAPYQEWWDEIDDYIFLEPEQIEYTVDWRMSAEAAMIRDGRGGMSQDRARAFIENFLPAYETFLPTFKEHLNTLPKDCVLWFTLGKSREIVSQFFRSTHQSD